MKAKKRYFKQSLGLAFVLLVCGVFGKEKILSAYEDVSANATVVKEMYDEELDVHQYILSNNIRLNLKSMALHEDVVPRISMRASFGRGELETPNQQAALPFVTKLFFMKGGIQPGSAFMEKTPSLHFSVEPDDFCFTSTTSSQKGLEILLRQMCGYLTASVYQEKSMGEARHKLHQIYDSLYKTPQGVCKDKVARLLASGDWKFGYPPRNEAMAITVDQIRSFLEKPLKDGYLELSIVGDFDVQECLKMVLETVGTLPRRDDSRPYLEKLRNVQFPQTPLKETFFIEDERHPTAFIMVVWPTDDGWDPVRARCLRVLAEVFTNNLNWHLESTTKIHTPYANNNSSLFYTHYGQFKACSYTEPAQADAVQKAILDTALNIRNAIGHDAFERAIQSILKDIDFNWNRLNYWLDAIDSSQEFPDLLNWIKSLRETYRNIKKEDVEAVAKKYLHPQKAVMIKILPQPISNEWSKKPLYE